MFVSLVQNYGSMHTGSNYEVIGEGRDFFLMKNGYHLPKNLAAPPIEQQIKEEEYELSDEWA